MLTPATAPFVLVRALLKNTKKRAVEIAASRAPARIKQNEDSDFWLAPGDSHGAEVRAGGADGNRTISAGLGNCAAGSGQPHSATHRVADGGYLPEGHRWH